MQAIVRKVGGGLRRRDWKERQQVRAAAGGGSQAVDEPWSRLLIGYDGPIYQPLAGTVGLRQIKQAENQLWKQEDTPYL